MSFRTLVESLIQAVAVDVTKLTRWTTGSPSGTDLTLLRTSDKTSLPAAINAVLDIATAASGGAGAAVIDDATTSTTKAWSSNKTNSSIQAAVATLVNSSPTTLDTLSELATALNNDPNFATTITAALGNRLRIDAAQTLTAAQSAQGRANLLAVGTADIGDTTTSLVSVYTAAKSA